MNHLKCEILHHTPTHNSCLQPSISGFIILYSRTNITNIDILTVNSGDDNQMHTNTWDYNN